MTTPSLREPPRPGPPAPAVPAPGPARDAGTAAAPLTTVRFPYRIGPRTLTVATRRMRHVRFAIGQLADWRPEHLQRCCAAPPMLLSSLPEAELPAVEAMHPDAILWVRQRFPHYWADLAQGWDGIERSMSGKTRSTLKRKERRLAEVSGGRVDARVYRTPAELAAYHPLARTVSRRTYQERLMDAGLPDGPAFLDGMRARAERGAAFGFLLFLSGEPVAYLYCPIEDSAAIYAYVGHLDEHSELSPGTVLQMFALRELGAARAARWFDFTPGQGQHKRIFATGWADCLDAVVLPPTPANRLLVASQRSFNGAVEQVRALAERHQLADRLRQLLRGRKP